GTSPEGSELGPGAGFPAPPPASDRASRAECDPAGYSRRLRPACASDVIGRTHAVGTDGWASTWGRGTRAVGRAKPREPVGDARDASPHSGAGRPCLAGCPQLLSALPRPWMAKELWGERGRARSDACVHSCGPGRAPADPAGAGERGRAPDGVGEPRSEARPQLGSAAQAGFLSRTALLRSEPGPERPIHPARPVAGRLASSGSRSSLARGRPTVSGWIRPRAGRRLRSLVGWGFVSQGNQALPKSRRSSRTGRG